ncbi:16S rRNA (adenine1518-N6/adenine1519-N6)-dimethyltransferase [Campylobacter pinnipediorum subsp. pinnipediorum]|uniref:16S rRNA (adenine(1518)-N(6)/adenine(1519)-N(6))- dimethyltransferase RsmA n=1 Tax=Campylobacter pinnipediorum TaxID=1965231 RepID=UPI000995B700|nr:16S rRNA (adenine(1518)-N(6)/adenine(1519)-N(6))-dimethyltransferase RsmA [Campylobacter pinnipediorum]AQW83752.1 16S rRNA (adenine1518-N6/adenine1519-N6)-dimethyltransferase [Campylobacter pinnipediorum subsp. pinnipediorum]
MIKAKKHFGQNFLQDASILSQIIQSIPKDNKDIKHIVEIGPGLGDLTFWLLKSDFKITSYEIDSELIPILLDSFKDKAENGQFRLINKDANLHWCEHKSLSDVPYILVANLPYYVATKMILNALEDQNCISIVAMTQKEVAMKFASNGGEREFSSLGVLANLTGSCKLLFDVAPECFDPIPKVVSSVLRIDKKQELLGDNGLFSNINEYHKFKDFLKACFIAPRKTLFKNLSSKVEKEKLRIVFDELDINQNLRPHESNVALYLKIYEKIKARNERKQ